MKKFIIIVAIVGISLFFISHSKNMQVTINSKSYQVEVALTPEQIKDGLMFHDELKNYEGMLFIFPDEDNRSFWTKNMLAPIDIIFINSKYEIIKIEKNALPCKNSDPEQVKCPTFPSGQKAKYVLEIKAGESEKNKFEIGQKVALG